MVFKQSTEDLITNATLGLDTPIADEGLKTWLEGALAWLDSLEDYYEGTPDELLA